MVERNDVAKRLYRRRIKKLLKSPGHKALEKQQIIELAHV